VSASNRASIVERAVESPLDGNAYRGVCSMLRLKIRFQPAASRKKKTETRHPTNT
jgi:hypothetical protein